jgi:hypothetical protein
VERRSREERGRDGRNGEGIEKSGIKIKEK